MPRAPTVRYGLRARLMVRVAALVVAVTAGLGLLLIVSETTNQHALLVKDGEILAQALAFAAGRYPPEQAQAALEDLFNRAAARFDVLDAAVADASGRIIAAHDRTRVGSMLELDRVSLHRATAGPTAVLRGALEPISIEVAAPIIAGDEARGFVSFRFQSARVVEKAQDLVRTVLAVLGVFLALGVGLAAVFVSRITRPLATLAEAAKDLGEGATVDVEGHGRDEVWLLGERLNAMSRGLRARADENARLIEDLRRLNRDLEDRVARATAGLRATRDALTAILASVEEAILTVDGRGRILTANRGAERLFGVREAALAGRRIAGELAPAGAAEAVDRALARVLAGDPQPGLELGEAPGIDGRTRSLEVDLAPIRGLDGAGAAEGEAEGPRAVATVRDRTERKKLESALRLADKLHSLGTVSASLTHELGNYANVVRGYCAVLLRDLDPASTSRADVAAIQRVNERTVTLLERFALFARPREPRFEPTSTAALVEDAAALLEPRLRAQGIHLERDLAPDLPRVRCDAALMVQALFNVLLNAMQAMARPGRIFISARARDGAVVIDVRDEGCGIAKEHMPRVFDPFFTTKPEGEGTGLGLPIVYRIIELHQGRVTVESEVGLGTTVRFELPAAAKEGSAP